MKNKFTITLMIGLLSVGVANAVGFDPRFGDDSSDVPAPQFNANQYRISQGMAIINFQKAVQSSADSAEVLGPTRNTLIVGSGSTYYTKNAYNPSLGYGLNQFGCDYYSCYNTSEVRIKNNSNKDIVITDILNYNADITNYDASNIVLDWVTATANTTNSLIYGGQQHPIIFYKNFYGTYGKIKYFNNQFRVIPAGEFRDIGFAINYSFDPKSVKNLLGDNTPYLPHGSFSADIVFADGSVKKISAQFLDENNYKTIVPR